MEQMLEVEGLTRRYGERVAVAGISFRIGRGESVGLLGPNGAGKTSTLAMISGIARPDAGTMKFAGVTGIEALKHRVGLVPQDLALFDELSAWANLQLFGGLYGLAASTLRERADSALALVGLADRRNDLVKSFSGGMKRRLNIAGALLHDPDLMLLDEPTVGVDPQSRNAIFENLEALKRRGKTLLYTTHYMEEAERLCERVLIMDHGRILADDSVTALKAQHGNLEQAFLALTGRALRDAAESVAA
ncbi:MAG TPA: ABC transporter ATP-binding protein [Steroidobacteraceae bacterium]|nr:ABC transporter ATP-binding protein [Steroidobacteraceae bacterium]